MRRAYRVTSHFLHYAYLAYERRLVLGRSEGAQVVVKADSLYLAALPVKAEAVLRRHVYGAYADALLRGVNLLAAGQDGGCEGVEVRRFGRPQVWVGYLAGHRSASVCGAHGLCLFINGVAAGVFQRELYGQPVGLVIACHLCRDAHRGAFRRGLVRAEPSAPVVKTGLRCDNQPDGAVQSAAGIPPAALFHVA